MAKITIFFLLLLDENSWEFQKNFTEIFLIESKISEISVL